MSKNDISMSYRIDALPGPVSKRDFYTEVIGSVRAGRDLPPGWEITWEWRNSATQAMRSDDLIAAARKSRTGFTALVLRRLERDARRQIPDFDIPEMREATEEEEEEAEELLQEVEEEGLTRPRSKKGEATRRTEKFEVRSAAAKKGWQTRHRNEMLAVLQAEKRKRSLAARKGWQTRKAKARGRKRR